MLRKSIFVCLYATVFIIFTYNVAISQIIPKSYLGLTGGYYSPTGDFSGDPLRGGPYWELAGGVHWGILGAELGVGYLAAENSKVDIKTVPILLSGKLRIPILFVVPYARGGIGAYYSDVNFKAGGGSGGTWSTGYHGGLGVDFRLGPVILGVEGTYLAVSPTVNERNITLDGLSVTGRVGFRFKILGSGLDI